ncbi:MAG: hypothetical protein IJ649_06215, partial [Oscillospiraceae bacterium]|nr:hypothetical protein [Oscillospiraceae bacterium]
MQEDRLGLAWHKFLIYCGIWICMLLCAGEAVLWFSGKAYGQILYHTRRGLRLFDIVIAVLYLANIILLVFARRGLANQSPHATETL